MTKLDKLKKAYESAKLNYDKIRLEREEYRSIGKLPDGKYNNRYRELSSEFIKVREKYNRAKENYEKELDEFNSI